MTRPDLPTLQTLALAALVGCNPTGTTLAATDSTAEASSTSSTTTPTTGDIITITTTTTSTTTTSDTTTTTITTSDTTTTSDTSGTTGADAPWTPKGCPEIYAQELLPTFELEFSDSELTKLKAEWAAADDDDLDEHPVAKFIYEGTLITDASARLRGNPLWWAGEKKMQLEISFNTYNQAGRFMGLKHILFDAAKSNESFLRDRLAMSILRDLGLPTPCVNNARLILNGDYYGLFTNIEKVDSEFLERNFEDPDGNLYKRAYWAKKTNEDNPDTSDIDALKDAKTLTELLALLNLEQATLEWAAEALLPDADGAWAGGLNAYYYNDPNAGFVIIPWDKDATFTRLPFDTDPFTYIRPDDWGRPFYDIATADPVWFGKYIDALALVLTQAYDVALLHQRIDTWAAQIADAATSDPNKPFSDHEHETAITELRDYIPQRAAFVAQWLQCWQQGGTDDDHDGQCDPP